MNKRISIIATTIALAVALAPAAAFADEAVLTAGADAMAAGVNTSSAQTVYFAGSDWRVIGYGDSGIASADGTATLLAADVMSSTYFNDNDNRNNHYAGSLLQIEVNGIANAIPAGEVAAIVPRTLAVSGYDDWNTSGVAGEQVEGAILWPLSTAEAYSLDVSLASLSTEYSDYGKWWWLRSPGGLEEIVAVVNADGFVDCYGHTARIERYGVRPAFNLNLNSVIFTSAAEGGKPSAGGGEVFSAVSGSGSGPWKLTLLDNARQFEVGKVTEADGVYTIEYSGAATGDNEWISAVIEDSLGDVKYYGKVASASASDTVEIDTSGLLAEGYTLYVFNEQCNDDFKTDYSSALVTDPHALPGQRSGTPDSSPGICRRPACHAVPCE